MRIVPFALTLLLALTACELDVRVEVSSSALDLAVADGVVYRAEPDDRQRAGRLDPLYFARQCQWDACGGPLERAAHDSEAR